MSAETVGGLRREIAARLAATSPSAALDARMIVAHAVGLAPDALIAADGNAIDGKRAAAARALAARRAAGEPVARILGEKEFYGLSFALSPDTLVPRPDTETVVDAVLADRRHDEAVAILDLGTGSGAILIALLHELPNATGVGIDFAEGAVAMARANAARHGVAARAAFDVGNWTRGIARRFDVVVANPPYIAAGDIASLPVEVRDHDPHLALDGGSDGLDAIRAILSDLDRVLAESGAAYVEIGFDQAPAITRLAAENGFTTAFRRDLTGVQRTAILRRKREPQQAVG